MALKIIHLARMSTVAVVVTELSFQKAFSSVDLGPVATNCTIANITFVGPVVLLVVESK